MSLHIFHMLDGIGTMPRHEQGKPRPQWKQALSTSNGIMRKKYGTKLPSRPGARTIRYHYPNTVKGSKFHFTDGTQETTHDPFRIAQLLQQHEEAKP